MPFEEDVIVRARTVDSSLSQIANFLLFSRTKVSRIFTELYVIQNLLAKSEIVQKKKISCA